VSLKAFDQRRLLYPGDTDVTGDPEKSRSRSLYDKPSRTPWNEIMEMRLIVTLVGLAISSALPIFAQQTAATLSEQDRQQLVALHKKWDEAENHNDAAALAALFTEDAAFVTDKGPVRVGRPSNNGLQTTSRNGTTAIISTS